jgi:phosphate acetyltransferase
MLMPANSTATAFMARLVDRARGLKKRIVFPEGGDPRVQAAAERLAREGVAQPILIGQGAAGGLKTIDPSTSDQTRRYAEWLYERRRARGMTHNEAQQLARQPLYYAALMVAAGDADGSVGGVTSATSETIRAALHTVGTAPGARLVSSAFLMAFEDRDLGHNGILAFADCAIVVDPSAVELAEIALATAETTRRIIGAEPVVALLSFSTKGSAQHPQVVTIVEALRVVRERAPSLHIDGELQLDAALVEAVGRAKAPGSTVAGRANTLIFPNLSAANIGYKLAERVAKATAIGPVLQGLAKPANDVSRGSLAEDIFHAAVVTAIQAESARHAGA